MFGTWARPFLALALESNSSLSHTHSCPVISPEKAAFFGYYLALPLARGVRPWGHTLLLIVLAEAVCGWVLAAFFQVAHVVGEVDFPEPDKATGKVAGGWAANQLHTTADFAPGSTFWMHVSGGLNHQARACSCRECVWGLF